MLKAVYAENILKNLPIPPFFESLRGIKPCSNTLVLAFGCYLTRIFAGLADIWYIGNVFLLPLQRAVQKGTNWLSHNLCMATSVSIL